MFSGLKWANIFELKEESIGPPSQCLGGEMRKVLTESGMEAWSFSSTQHVQSACKNVREHTRTRGWKIPRAGTPLSPNYRPELDMTSELNVSDAAHFQSLIGVLRWTVEIGRVDICSEVSMMSSHLALPRERHLQQVTSFRNLIWKAGEAISEDQSKTIKKLLSFASTA